jgi:CheY-like chemotaxis protein
MILVSATWMGCTWPSGSPARCRCSRPRRARSAPAGSTTGSSRGARRVRVADRGVQHDGRRAGLEPRGSSGRASTSSASTSEVEGGAATSRRSSSASPPASSRSTPRAHRAPSTAPPAAARARRRRRRQPRSRCSRARPAPVRAAARRGAAARREEPRRRRSRSCATAASCTWPRRHAAARARGAPRARCSCFDDVTPLIRAQKVAAWREVARRLAHEIKNPLTPIQLSAERMRRTSPAPRPARLVDECTTTIVGEVESLKGLVDEFSQFARMPAPRAVPTDLHALLDDTLALYNGLFATSASSAVRGRAAAGAGRPRADPRVIINLVDNAVEAMGGGAAIVAIETAHDAATIGVADHRRRRRAGHSGGRARQAVPAVLLDQGARQRPRPGHRPPHRRRARRQHRGEPTTAAGTRFTIELPLRHDRAATLKRRGCAWPSCYREGHRPHRRDDEPGVRSALSGVLRDEGYDVEAVDSGEACLDRAAARPYDVIVLDVWLPGIDGLATLQRLRERQMDAQVVMISGTATSSRPCAPSRWARSTSSRSRCRSRRRCSSCATRCGSGGSRPRTARCARTSIGARWWARATRCAQLREQVAMAAPTNGRVLIYGENGTGKELVARTHPRAQPPARRPFVEVNCAAIPEELIESELFGHVKGAFTGAVADRRGKFELADGGTIFLDEIGDMSLKTQAKVLRVLQEQVDRAGRRHAASGGRARAGRDQQGPAAEIRAGRFREDLYFRLNVIPIFVPPLRDRAGRHPAAGRSLHGGAGARSTAGGRSGSTPEARRRGCSSTLARQRPRAAQRDRAADDHGAGRHDHGAGPGVPRRHATAAVAGGRRRPPTAAAARGARSFERDYILRRWPRSRATSRARPRCSASSAATCTRRCARSASPRRGATEDARSRRTRNVGRWDDGHEGSFWKRSLRASRAPWP